MNLYLPTIPSIESHTDPGMIFDDLNRSGHRYLDCDLYPCYALHHTLQNFDTQQDLSCRQLRWQELLSHYDMTIIYIPGEDNTMADALLWVPDGTFPDESPVPHHCQ
jgi:hypothetical protein